MENKRCRLLPNMAIVFFLLALICMFSSTATAQDVELSDVDEKSSLQTYIVYVKKPDGGVYEQLEDLESWYKSFLPVSIASSNQQQRMVYSYRNVVTGFAARLTAEEAKAMEEKDGFVSARPERRLSLQTTHTPLFLGLHQGLGFWNESNLGSLRHLDVKGKVVLCERGGGIGRIDKGQTVKDAGGAAMILMNAEPDGFSTLADAHVLPATHVSYAAGLNIKDYINSTSTPMATILFKGTIIGASSAPAVSSFSSRGPSMASHVNPSRANDPGLVYDVQPDDYIPYLCGLGYTDKDVGVIAHRSVNCSKESIIPEAQLNYPSFSIILGSRTQNFTRTVTNVGQAHSSYTVEIVAPIGVSVTVNPYELDFSKVNQKMTYTVTFRLAGGRGKPSAPFSQGYLQWVSGQHSVRSPIVVIFE
ncbi:hypothetical protein L1049_007148 [Liquidambar formosana]|uniref:Subtilisin-like protease SBT1.2 n=1 Tax=Liquidambar formosana TaxID=63359 RepID=A0AAP0RIC4_LIQFO